jgi:transcriptional regulator with XRE-family HTH domain
MARHETRHGEAKTLAKVFGDRLCRAQEIRGIKTEPLARLTGVGLRDVQRHRSGKNLPKDETIRLYARVLDFPFLWFFQDEEEAA